MAGDRPQPLASLPVADALGLASIVATGHHHGSVQVVEDQMVQGGMGQHHPQAGHPGGQVRGQGQIGLGVLPIQHHNGRRWAGQQGRLLGADPGVGG